MKEFLRHFEITIANDSVYRINAYANYLKIVEYSASDKIEISLANQAFEKIPSGISMALPQGEEFSYIDLKNETGADVSVELMLSNALLYDNNLSISNELNADISTDTIATPAPVTATAVAGAVSIPSEVDRRELIIQNNHATYDVWIGDANVNSVTSRGIKLLAGQQIILTTSAQIHFHSPSGNATLSYMSLSK